MEFTREQKAKLSLKRLKADILNLDAEILQISEELNAVAIKINNEMTKELANKIIDSVDSNIYADHTKNKINGPCVLVFFKD
jgi:hypothetical protein